MLSMFWVAVFRRLAEAAVVCFGVSFLTFALTFLMPADPVAAIAGIKVSPETRRQIRQDLGLDRPVWVQYGLYLKRLLRGDLGRSFVTQQQVSEAISERLAPTVLLALTAWCIALVLGVCFSCLGAMRRSWQPLLFASSSLWLAIPPFWLGLLLLYAFAFYWPLFPLGGYSALGVVLPACALAAGMAAAYYRILEANLREVLAQPFIQAAHAKGLPPSRVVLLHALRNAILPVVTLLALDLAGLLGGVTLTETVFHWPGLGRLAVEAVFNQDLPMLMGVVLVTTVILVALNAIADLLHAWIDPRVRQAEGEG